MVSGRGCTVRSLKFYFITLLCRFRTLTMSKFVIRELVSDDCEELARLIKELAAYEKLADRVSITPDILRRDGFGPDPYYRCMVAEKLDEAKPTGTLVAYGMFYKSYSTFEGRSLYLEDLYVSQEFRKHGIASEILRRIAEIGLSDGCRRLDFVVLSWNELALNFYRKRDAVDLTSTEQWHLLRLYDDELKRLAGVAGTGDC